MSKSDKYIKYEGGKKDSLPSEFTSLQGLSMILKLSFSPILGYLFHPSYMMINVKVLGLIKPPEGDQCSKPEAADTVECMNGEQYQAAFGIGSSTVAIFLLASSICFSCGLYNVIPQAFGSKNYKLCGAYRNRMIILVTCIFTPILIPLQFVKHFFLAIG